MEQASRTAIEERVPNGMLTVGTMINVRHLAATPLGQSVRAEAQLKGIEGRRLLFDVTAHDEFERVAEGEHERAILSLEKFLSKIKEKSKSSY